MQQDPLAALGLLIRKFGYKVDGGWEIFVPEQKLLELGSHANIQVEPVPDRKGFKFRVYFNKTIQGTWSEHKDDVSESGSGPNKLAEKNDEAPA